MPAPPGSRSFGPLVVPARDRRTASIHRGLRLIALALLIACAGCRTGRGGGDVAVVRPEPDLPPPPAPPPAAEPLPTPLPEISMLAVADEAFEEGDLQVALGGYRSYLEEEDGDEAVVERAAADRALFRVALLHLVNGGPAPDRGTGFALLRRLVREHPESGYRHEAELILGLESRIEDLDAELERLQDQLEALKRIDLERAPDRGAP